MTAAARKYCTNGKRRYPSETAADDALGGIWRTPRPGRYLEARAYRCDTCSGWHLTHLGSWP